MKKTSRQKPLNTSDASQRRPRRRESNRSVRQRTTMTVVSFESNVLDRIGGGIVVVSPRDGRILYSNRHFDRMLGYRHGELVGKNVCVLHASSPAVTPEKAAQKIQKSLRSSGSWEGEIWCVAKRGRIVVCRVAISEVALQGYGEVWLGVHEDITARKESEEALQAMVKQQEAILETIPNPAWLKDQKERFVAVNAAWQKAMGISAAKVLGKTALQLFSRPSGRELAREDQAVIRKGVRIETEHLLTGPDGEERCWSTFKGPVRDASGSVVGLVGLSTDITERTQIHQALQASEVLHRAILRTAMDGFWLADAKGRLLEVNDAYCRMSGYTRQELLKMRISDVEVCENPREVAAHFRKVMAQGQDRFETRHRRKDGTVFDVDICVQKCPGRAEQTLVFMRDITERKAAHEQLRTSEGRFRGLFEQSPVALCELDLSETKRYIEQLRRRGVKDLRKFFRTHPVAVDSLLSGARLRGANDTMLRLHRVGSVEELGAHHAKVRATEARQMALDVRIAMAEGQTTVESPAVIVTSDGQRLHAIIRYHILPGAEETWDRVVVATVDVTPIKKAQQELESAHRKLMHATEAEQRRIAKELHDSIAQQAVGLQLMLKNLQRLLAESDAAAADSIGVATEHCSGIVRGLREICYGLYPQTLEQFGLPSALRQLVGAPSLAGLRTEVIITSEATKVRLDPDVEIAIYRIAQEAVSNVMRHSKATSLAVHLLTDNLEGTLVLAVTDNGKGFSEEHEWALGLGMVSMRERAEAVRGKFRVDSRPGGGTTIFLVVPLDAVGFGS